MNRFFRAKKALPNARVLEESIHVIFDITFELLAFFVFIGLFVLDKKMISAMISCQFIIMNSLSDPWLREGPKSSMLRDISGVQHNEPYRKHHGYQRKE